MSNLVGQQIEHYQIDALLGEGGMATVYEARDLNLARPVAVKVIQTDLVRQLDFDRRFLEEAQATARLDHPSIIRVYDFRSEDELLYMVMEYIAGGSLTTHLRRLQWRDERMDLDEAIKMATQIAEALDHAHHHDVIHGDVKPDNILLKLTDGEYGRLQTAVVTDFGLVALHNNFEIMVGSWPYMSPEQCLNDPIDGRSDIYSLGVVLYQLVTGRLPFIVESLEDAIQQHINESAPAPRELNPDISEELETVIRRAMDKTPDSRYQTGYEFAQALRQLAPSPAGASIPLTSSAPPTDNSGSNGYVVQTHIESAEEIARHSQNNFNQWAVNEDQITISQAAPRSHVLDEEIITIGRSAENDIVLNHPSVSMQHASLKRTATGTWQVIDLGSRNGVYLDGTALLPQVGEDWYPTQTLRVGPFFLRLRAAGTSVDLSANTQPVNLLLTPNKIDLEPGAFQDVQILVVNQGKERNYFQIAIEDISSDWYSLAQDALRLMPGERGNLQLRLHPPSGLTTTSGEHRYHVTAHSLATSEELASVPGIINVKPVTGFTLEMEPTSFEQEGVAQIHLHNQANFDATYTLAGYNEEEAIRFGVEEEIEVAASSPAPRQRTTSQPQRSGGGGLGALNGILQAVFSLPFMRRFSFARAYYQTAGQAQMYKSAGRRISRATGVQGGGTNKAYKQPSTGEMVTKQKTGKILYSTSFEKEIVIPAGQREIINLQVVAEKRPFFGRGQTLPFTVEAIAPSSEPKIVEGELAVKPTVSSGCVTAVVAVMLLVCLIGLGVRALFWFQPFQLDDDQDNLTNNAEISEYFTDPNNNDTDGDGVLDGDEISLGLNPLAGDTDNDGLSDREERELGTNPRLIDSDGDRIPDGVELNNLAINPLVIDSDGDSLSDCDELELGLDPALIDSDRDGIRDDEEAAELRVELNEEDGYCSWPPPIRVVEPTATPLPTVIPTVTPTPTPAIISVVIESNGSQDGYIIENGSSNSGGEVVNSLDVIVVGDSSENNLQLKGFLSFDTSSIPDNAIIQSVSLRVRRASTNGAPYSLGVINVDIAPAGGFSNNLALEASDFEADAAIANIATLGSTANDGDWADVLLNSDFYQAIRRNGSTQFRIYFTLPDDRSEAEALIGFNSGNADPDLRPQLLITYLVP